MLEWLWFFVACVLALPSLVFVAECLADAVHGMAKPPAPAALQAHSTPDVPVCVLIPAHNEAVGIARTLRSIRPQLQPHDRILVVADNCTDPTAMVALAEGAEVLERTHASLRGKGYALDHGIAHLKAHAPEQVLMVDADCVLHPGSLAVLRQACEAHQGPVQCCDLMKAGEHASLSTRVAEFAWLVKNQVRPAGAAKLGWPCQLMGTGMMFPWAVIADAPLASGHLAEDMQLGANLALKGQLAKYVQGAKVTSSFPEKDDALAAQRRRWEHGHLEMIQRQGLPLLLAGLRRRDWALTGLALDMCVPPLTSLVFLNLAAVCVSFGGWLVSQEGFQTALGLGLACQAAMALAIVLTWMRLGRAIIQAHELISAPVYMLRKLSIYASYVSGRKSGWVRAERDQRDD